MSSKRRSPATTGERIGVKLKEMREQAGLSLRTLAERAGFSASFISQIENGDVSASISSLEKIAATLNGLVSLEPGGSSGKKATGSPVPSLPSSSKAGSC